MIRYEYPSETAADSRGARLRITAYRLLQVVEDGALAMRRRI